MLVWSLLTVLVVLMVAVLPTWPYSTTWGYYPSSLLALLLFVALILFLVGAFQWEAQGPAPRPPAT